MFKYNLLIDSMMSRMFIIPIACLFPFMIKAHEEPPKTLKEKQEKERSKDAVRTSNIERITAWRFEIEDGEITDLKTKLFIQEFDREGNVISHEAYKNDTLQLRVEYTYDTNGNLTDDIDYSPEGFMVERNIFEFDREGRMVSGSSFTEDTLTATFTYTASEDKRSLLFTKLNADETIDYTIDFIYPDDFDLNDYTEAIKTDGESNLMLRVKKKFNATGSTYEKIIFGADSSESYRFIYTYDDRHNTTNIQRVSPKKTIEWVDLFTYDLNGNRTSFNRLDPEGKPGIYIRYEFDYRD